MKRLLLGFVLLGAPLHAAVLRQTLDDTMTRGKLAADLGDHAAATRAFKAVADDASAPAAQRIEARVRLGSALRSAGDHEGALAAFQRAAKDPALDRGTKALLVQAVGGALPGPDRWDKVWPRVTFVVDRSDARRPGLAIRWPEAGEVKPEYSGELVDLELKDGDIVDVLRLFGNVGGVNMLIDPAVQGTVTVKLRGVPWDQALDTIVKQHGLTWHRDDSVVTISRSGRVTETKRYTGEPITLDFKNGDLLDILGLFRNISDLNVVLGHGVGGKLSLKVNEMPWDQVLDGVTKMHGLSWRREGNVLWITGAGWMPPTHAYSSKPIDVHLNGEDVAAAFDTIAKAADLEVRIDPAVEAMFADPRWIGSRTVTLELKQVPGDHALELAARVVELGVDREGNRFTVRPVFRKRVTGKGAGELASFAIGDVQVRGILSRKGADPVAFLLGPEGKTYFPKAGQQLVDGEITAVDATGVTFRQKVEGGDAREVKKPIQGADAPVEVRPASASTTPEAPAVERPTVYRARRGDLVDLKDGAIVAPVLTRKVNIVKPQRAVAAKVQGTVLIGILVDENGKPAEVQLQQRIAHPLGEECNEVALSAARQMRWEPATKDGVPVKVWITVKIPF
jgi:TonB family protein